MSNSREVRELQFTRMQLVIVFILVIALGAFIFVLGVSVGKKQARLAQGLEQAGGAPAEVVKPRVKLPSSGRAQKAKTSVEGTTATPVEKKAAPSSTDIQKEIASFKAQEQPTGKTSPTAAKKTKSPAQAPAVEVKKTAPAKTIPEAKKTSTVSKPPISQKPPVNLYYIQVAAATQKTEAAKLAEEIRKLGYNAYVLDPLPSDRVAYYRVRVGGYRSEEERSQAAGGLAAALNKKVTELYFPSPEKN